MGNGKMPKYKIPGAQPDAPRRTWPVQKPPQEVLLRRPNFHYSNAKDIGTMRLLEALDHDEYRSLAKWNNRLAANGDFTCWHGEAMRIRTVL
ncbi:hypothetical protein BGX29_004110, partial [Mortierella sp. GBA35]